MPLSELEALTGATDLQILGLGDSIVKYSGFYRGEKVVLRIYPKDDYYSNRFIREGAALRALAKTLDSLSSDCLIIVPEIIGEWTNTTQFGPIRALTWIKGIPFDKIIHPLEPTTVVKMIEILHKAGQNMPEKFSFQKDFLAHFNHPVSAGEWNNAQWQLFTRLSSQILKGLNSNHYAGSALIHGDFHYGNILNLPSLEKSQKPKYAIIDWEFATRGSIFFDLAYLHVFSGWEPPRDLKREIEMWEGLALAAITHWYLINTPHSTYARIWLEKLEMHVTELS